MLDELEKQSIFILREVKSQFKNPFILCSFGKDSTTLLHLSRKANPEGLKVQFPVMHIDTGLKLPEIYEFKQKLIDEWDLEVITVKNSKAFKMTSPYADRFKCCMERKTNALKKAIAEYDIDALVLAIRRDELPERGIERYFSPRKRGNWEVIRPKKPSEKGDSPFEYLQDAEFAGWSLYIADWSDKEVDHYRIHPMLHWTELDVWQYIKQENIPVNPLYFAVNGYRYRSIGCAPCTSPIESDADTIDKIIEEIKSYKGVGERAGRAQDKEKIMRRLRALGYM